MIGTSDQSCWLAEACKILLLLQCLASASKGPSSWTGERASTPFDDTFNHNLYGGPKNRGTH